MALAISPTAVAKLDTLTGLKGQLDPDLAEF
ncbi:aldo/keto reductase family oxidoreductase [Streptococcus suis]|uniref:Aldo/keto reductase family oxidoreductase n=1 Tax=Streptococcus suis TaxID=1307 RepID=A0A116PNT4_STRSU|nr:aldo/keto reductase family oxidoreductase [Streptococcus suis]